ncbi:nuclear transport factor 2 family protein [Trujillonella humicola]|uniref:nuclear transport factor 2 family protein n=1 Tax=Trujillonella humicola TaxID=3383699 RepID=UPI003905E449
MSGAGTRAAVTAFLDALNGGDPDVIAARVTEDFVNEHTSARGRSLTGRAAYRERLPGFLAAFAGLRYEVEDVLVDGDRAAVAYRLTARMQRDGAPEVPVDVRGVFRFRVRDGLVAARADYWDGEVVAAQTAAVDAAGTTAGARAAGG